MEAAAGSIPTYPRSKWRVPCESIVVGKKLDNVKKKNSYFNKRNPSNFNTQTLKKVLRE